MTEEGERERLNEVGHGGWIAELQIRRWWRGGESYGSVFVEGERREGVGNGASNVREALS